METRAMQWFRVLKDSKQMVIRECIDMKLMKIPLQSNLGEQDFLGSGITSRKGDRSFTIHSIWSQTGQKKESVDSKGKVIRAIRAGSFSPGSTIPVFKEENVQIMCISTERPPYYVFSPHDGEFMQ